MAARKAKSVEPGVESAETVDRRRIKGVSKGVKRPAVLMSPDYVKKIREGLGLSQSEFAQIIGVTNITVNSWEKVGVESVRGGSFFLMRALVAMLKEAIACPDFISVDRLKRYLKMGANQELAPYYMRYSDELDSEFVALLNSGLIMGTMGALLFDAHLESTGRESPEKAIMKLHTAEDVKDMGLREDTEFLEKLAAGGKKA
jgi:DNA-binding transcriptional regulator YiaG